MQQRSQIPQDLRIEIAIVGLKFGQLILRQLRDTVAGDLFRVVAVCDTDTELLARVAEAEGVTGYSSLDALLDGSSAQVIGLFTPPSGRAGLIRQIIAAGRDVLSTKPFELIAQDARDVLEEAAEAGIVVQLNSPPPKAPDDLATMMNWQKSHDLGRLVGARGGVWASYAERSDGTWMDDPLRCPAAPLFRLGIYVLNDITALAGETADQVSVTTSSVRTGRPTPDNAMMTVRFKGGALANIYGSFCIDDGWPYRNSLELHFERGSIYKNVYPAASGGRDSSRAELTLVTPGGEGESMVRVERPESLGHGYDWTSLAHAVRERIVASPAYQTRICAGVEIIEAMAASDREGRPIDIESSVVPIA